MMFHVKRDHNVKRVRYIIEWRLGKSGSNGARKAQLGMRTVLDPWDIEVSIETARFELIRENCECPCLLNDQVSLRCNISNLSFFRNGIYFFFFLC